MNDSRRPLERGVRPAKVGRQRGANLIFKFKNDIRFQIKPLQTPTPARAATRLLAFEESQFQQTWETFQLQLSHVLGKPVDPQPLVPWSKALRIQLVNNAIRNIPGYVDPRFEQYVYTSTGDATPTQIEKAKALIAHYDFFDPKATYFERPAPPPAKIEYGSKNSGKTHLEAAPIGVGALDLDVDCGGALGVLIDRGWIEKHEDLPPLPSYGPGSVSRPLGPDPDETEYARHGTWSFGCIAAITGSTGVTGIAQTVTLAGVSCQLDSANPLPDVTAISYAIEKIALNRGSGPADASQGEVIVIERQSIGSLDELRPVECYYLAWKLIQTATMGNNITIVEPAGNGRGKIDGMLIEADTEHGNGATIGDFYSGAIMVAAGTSNIGGNYQQHARWDQPPTIGSNYGDRVDCYAWGDSIQTCDTRNGGVSDYTGGFGMTSGASAIIGGCVLALQSFAKQRFGNYFTTPVVRAWLSDPNWGTPSNDPTKDKIGIMPDLRRLLARMPIV